MSARAACVNEEFGWSKMATNKQSSMEEASIKITIYRVKVAGLLLCLSHLDSSVFYFHELAVES